MQSSPRVPSLGALRELAAARGVHPADADLEAARGFLAAILPALDALERELPADVPPAGLPLAEGPA